MTQSRTSAKLRLGGVVTIMLLTFWLPSAVSRRPDLTAGLAGSLTDAKSGKPLTARIQLTREGRFVLPPGFTFYDKERDKHFYVPSTFRLPLAPGQYTIRIERGKEYRPLIETFSVSASQDARRDFKLERWINMEERGWYSGDLHVHRPAEVMAETLLAEDLNFAPLISTHYWSKWDSVKKTPRPTAARVQVDGTHVFST